MHTVLIISVFVMPEISKTIEMKLLVSTLPGARRALFSRYHIGGCSSCAYRDDETLEEVCERNEIDAQEAIDHLLQSHELDQAMLLSPTEVKRLLDAGEVVVMLDTRTREEHEAVKIEGSELMTQDRQQQLFSVAKETDIIVLYDHRGDRVLDTCAWFQGHGMKGTRGLAGGIDAWSLQVDPTLQRYRLEMD